MHIFCFLIHILHLSRGYICSSRLDISSKDALIEGDHIVWWYLGDKRVLEMGKCEVMAKVTSGPSLLKDNDYRLQ